MQDAHGIEIYEENDFLLAYLLTFRTFGTWLHGDERLSVGRDGRNHYGKPRIHPKPEFETAMKGEMKQPPFILTKPMRRIVESAIKELCQRRGYGLSAVNVRTNHAHAVVSAQMKPERIADALKANATKMLREELLISSDTKVWSRGRSRKYLWKPKHVSGAIDYVLYCQSDIPFELLD
ncbi:MAG: transposase [Chloracidobacterium sp.]|nr:transposase [Chloracidobacterium sp.]MBK9438230.1 transposase [Chloracidobacterium sp.]MBL0240890.1 transposase [Chloracidobacterium sp.]